MHDFPDQASDQPSLPEKEAKAHIVETLKRPYYFVHFPECGGRSVGHALQGYDDLHTKASEWAQNTSPGYWANRSSFAIVRCPYERFLSLYGYNSVVSELPEGKEGLSLHDWIAHELEGRAPQALDTYLTLHPCHTWVIGANGQPMADLICRLEKIKHDWPLVCDLTGVHVDLRVKNRTVANARSSVVSLTVRSKSIIEEYYTADFKHFGYEHIGATQKLKPCDQIPFLRLEHERAAA